MKQKVSSKNTSINSKKLPAIVKHINWEAYRGCHVLDFGGGKFDNLKRHLKDEYNIQLYVYDPYNRSEDENKIAITCNPSLIICSNVLNVIDSDGDLKGVIKLLNRYGVPTVYYIYEGDKSGEGRVTKADCYQRNAIAQQYLKFFKVIETDSRCPRIEYVRKNIIEVRY